MFVLNSGVAKSINQCDEVEGKHRTAAREFWCKKELEEVSLLAKCRIDKRLGIGNTVRQRGSLWCETGVAWGSRPLCDA